MRAPCTLAVLALVAVGVHEWLPTGWLKNLQQVAIAKERRPVRLALVTNRDADWERTSDYGFRAVLRDPGARARVFAPGSIGYTIIPPRPKPISIFVNRDRVEPALTRLVAAHELGHVLLHARGYLQLVVPAGSPDEPLLADCFNAVQDVLLEGELLAQHVDTQPLLVRQLSLVRQAITASGVAAVPDTGHLNASHLATMVVPLLLAVRGMDDAKQSVRAKLPRGAAGLVARYTLILSAPVSSADQYRDVVYRACEANGVTRGRVRFADD